MLLTSSFTSVQIIEFSKQKEPTQNHKILARLPIGVISKYVECYESPHLTSTYVYNDIKNNIEQLIEDAISNAGTY